MLPIIARMVMIMIVLGNDGDDHNHSKKIMIVGFFVYRLSVP